MQSLAQAMEVESQSPEFPELIMKRLREEVESLKGEYNDLKKAKDERDDEIRELRQASSTVLKATDADRQLMETFNKVDSDHSGKINASEFRIALQDWQSQAGGEAREVTIEEAANLIRDLEESTPGMDDGELDFEEFKEVLKLFCGGTASNPAAALGALSGYASEMKSVLKDVKGCNEDLLALEARHAELLEEEGERNNWIEQRDAKILECQENQQALHQEELARAKYARELDAKRTKLREIEHEIEMCNKEKEALVRATDGSEDELAVKAKEQRKTMDELGQRHNLQGANEEMESDIATLMELLSGKFTKMQGLLNDTTGHKESADFWLQAYAAKGSEYLYERGTTTVEVSETTVADFEATLEEYEQTYRDLKAAKKGLKAQMAEVRQQFSGTDAQNQALEDEIVALRMEKQQAEQNTEWLEREQHERRQKYEEVVLSVQRRVEEITSADRKQRFDLRKLLKTIQFRSRMRELEARKTAETTARMQATKSAELRGLWAEVARRETAIVASFKATAHSMGRDYEAQAEEISNEVAEGFGRLDQSVAF